MVILECHVLLPEFDVEREKPIDERRRRCSREVNVDVEVDGRSDEPGSKLSRPFGREVATTNAARHPRVLTPMMQSHPSVLTYRGVLHECGSR